MGWLNINGNWIGRHSGKSWSSYCTQLRTTWQPAVLGVATSRASIAVIGDSITAGFITPDMDADSYVSVLRAKLKNKYSDGGEGFLTAFHNYIPSTNTDNRWTYGGEWIREYAATRTGSGAIASRMVCLGTGRTASLTFTGDSIQVMTGINHSSGGMLEVKIDGVVKANISLRGSGIDANLEWGHVTTITGLTNASHTLLITTVDNPASAADYAWFEGVRPLIGSSGIVVDRFGKGWLQANWLGEINESNAGAAYLDSLRTCVDVLDTDLFIVTLGINDYIGQVALNTFESRLTTIVQRCKAVADTIIVVCPQPNSALTIPYSSYITRMTNVATAEGALLIDLRDDFGMTFNAPLMSDNNHPNVAGHTLMATRIYNEIVP